MNSLLGILGETPLERPEGGWDQTLSILRSKHKGGRVHPVEPSTHNLVIVLLVGWWVTVGGV